MNFWLVNLILVISSAITYTLFRIGVYSYCRLNKMSKTYIRKSRKGISNYWFYSKVHKENNLGVLYYLNLLFFSLFVIHLILFAFSWISFIKSPTTIVGFMLCIATIPVYCTFLIYYNLENLGKPFVIFMPYKDKSTGGYRISTVLEWFFCIIPLVFYTLANFN